MKQMEEKAAMPIQPMSFVDFFVALNHILKSQNSGDREAM